MRNFMFLGATAIALAFGVGNAYAGNIDPHESPYAILEPLTVAPSPAPMSEGRAAYTGGDQGNLSCRPGRVQIRGVWNNAQVCD